MIKAEVDPIILLCAFRYGLGRSTYIVRDIADALIANKGTIRPDWCSQIVRDIDTAIEYKDAGMECDEEIWREVAQVFEATDNE